jgi:hypothetical protein
MLFIGMRLSFYYTSLLLGLADAFTSITSVQHQGRSGGLQSRLFESSSRRTACDTKQVLLDLLAQTPSNSATPASLTTEILSVVEQLERTESSFSADDDFLNQLAGTWTLLWTTQDKSRVESRFAFLNPLENQSYSNNPNAGGRANPVLPRPVQEGLERLGFITQEEDEMTTTSQANSKASPPVQSTQTVDVKKQQVINVVSFYILGGRRRVTLTVTVDFYPLRYLGAKTVRLGTGFDNAT